MQQISASSGWQCSEAQGTVSSYSAASVGDCPHSHRSRASSASLKKRERIESFCEQTAKQQRIDNGQALVKERTISPKSEASALVGKDGGMSISSLAHVDRFVCIMGREWNKNSEKQLDLVVSRTMLAKVVGTTADRECLVKFLELGGLAILDKWLEEVHRGRHFVDEKVTKDGDKAVQELLLALLEALERLPIDLNILQACPVGESVNLLRNHAHPEVQRRAKKLLNAWKKMVMSEMNLELNGGLQASNAPLNSHHPETAATHSQPLKTSFPEISACLGNSNGGPNKFVSASSLWPFPGGQLRSQQSSVPIPWVEHKFQDFPGKVVFPAHSTTDALKSELSNLSQLLGTSSPNRQNGRTKSTDDKAAVADLTFLVNSRASQGAAVPKTRKNASASDVSGWSAAAPMSSLVNVPNASAACGSKSRASPSNSDASLLSRSSSGKKLHMPSVCNGLTRSSLESVTDVTDCKVRSSFPYDTSTELSKAGDQLLAGIAADEESAIDFRGSDSLLNKSVCMQVKMGISMDSKLLQASNVRCNSLVHSRTRNELQNGEYFDQLSSNESCPSETSGHADLRTCDSKTSQAFSANTAHRPENLLVVGGYTVDVEMKSGAPMLAMNGMQPVSDDTRKGSFQPCPVVEAFGESRYHVRGNHEDSVESQPMAGLSAGYTGKGMSLIKRTPRIENANAHSLKVTDTMVNQRNGGAFYGSSSGGSSARNSSFCGDSTSGRCPELKLKSPSREILSGAFSNSLLNLPIFDLNEVVTCEDGTLVTPGNAMALPLQDVATPLLSALDNKPTLPVTPTAPIAVAAAKGYFTLPSVSHFPKGEIGWKGTAPTSAFRRAQPRQKCHNASINVAVSSHSKLIMDFDLNVAAAADSGCLDHTAELSSHAATPFPVNQGRSCTYLDTMTPPQQGQNARQDGGALDLNQVSDARESKWRQDIDLNCGPLRHNNDEDVLAKKFSGIRPPLVFDFTNSGASSKEPSHPLESVASVLIPALAMPNSDSPYPVGASVPSLKSGAPDGMFQYNIFQRNYPDLAGPSLPSLPVASYQCVPYAFPSVSMKNLSAPFLDTIGDQYLGSPVTPSTSSADQSLLLPQSRSLPHMLGIIADATQHRSDGGLWCRSNIDLNACPDGGDAKNVKEDIPPMAAANEQLRTRHWAVQMALKQREQDGGMSLPLGMQGVCSNQSVWR